MAKGDVLYDNPRSKSLRGQQEAKKGDTVKGDAYEGTEYESLGSDDEVTAEDKEAFKKDLAKRQQNLDKRGKAGPADYTYHPTLQEIPKGGPELWRRKKRDEPTS